MIRFTPLVTIARSSATVVLLATMGACSLSRQSARSDDEKGLPACKAPAKGAWTWKSANINGVKTEVPTPFVERLGVDTRSRSWEYGPRSITLTLTTDQHTERSLPFISGRCELELGERSVEVVTSTNADNDRLLTARVPNVDGGFDLLVQVSTRYAEEVAALRRVITSVTVADSTHP